MARIVLVCMYDNWALGLRTMANALTANGHEVATIHFKLPSRKKTSSFLKHPLNYENLISLESRLHVIINSYNIDINIWTHNELLLLGDLLEELAPDIIGLSTRSVYENHIAQVIEQMKRVKGALTVAGGHDASFRPDLYAKYVDFACVGEGEDALLSLASAIDSGSSTKDIGNLVYQRNDAVVYNPLLAPSDEQDFFYVDGMDKVAHYVIEDNTWKSVDFLLRDVAGPGYTERRDYYTMFGRGCPGRCGFCSAGDFRRLYTEKGVPVMARRIRPLERVMAELKQAKGLGFRKVIFLDSFFLAPRKVLLEFFDTYRDEIGLPFFAQLYPEQVLMSPEILNEACRAGMTETVIGIQSGSPRINKDIFNRRTPQSKVIAFADVLATARGVKVDYHLITHNPFETEEDLQEALDLLKRLPKKNACLVLQRLRPFVNTRIERLLREEDVSHVDRETLDKRFLLCLLRYSVPDDEFERLLQDFGHLGFDDLKLAYTDLRHRYKDAAGWTDLGWNHYYERKYDTAIDEFEKALLLDGNQYRALVGKAWCHLQKSNYGVAEEAFQEASQHAPLDDQQSRQEIFRGLGWSYYHRANYDKAIAFFSQALEETLAEQTHVRQELLQALGLSHQKAGNSDRGRQFFVAEDNLAKDLSQFALTSPSESSGGTHEVFQSKISRISRSSADRVLYALRSTWFRIVGRGR